MVCGIWSWSGWCEGLLGDVQKWVVCGLCVGLGVAGVRDYELEWVVCGIRSSWCAGFGVGVGGVRGCRVVCGSG